MEAENSGTNFTPFQTFMSRQLRFRLVERKQSLQDRISAPVFPSERDELSLQGLVSLCEVHRGSRALPRQDTAARGESHGLQLEPRAGLQTMPHAHGLDLQSPQKNQHLKSSSSS